MCGWAILHIWAYRRDVRSLPTRLVLGVLVANFVYASTDVIPVQLHHLEGPRCGWTLIGSRYSDTVAKCFPTATMFFGVWMTTMYELMMVLLSTRALYIGSGNVPRHTERALHALGVGAGAAALIGYYCRCRDLFLGQAELNSSPATSADYAAGVTKFDVLQRASNGLPGLLWGWALGPTVLATLGWVYQRWMYQKMMKEWEHAALEHAAFEKTDAMAMTGLDAQFDTRSKLLGLKKDAYVVVVKPLEPYVVAIIVFMIPQAIAISDACQTQTEATTLKGRSGDANTALPCESVAALVLAFRAIALASVYLRDVTASNERGRSELFDVPELFRRAWARFRTVVASTCGWTAGYRVRTAGRVRFPPNELDGLALVPVEGEGRSSSFRTADHDIFRMGTVASQNLTELDLAAADRAEATTAEDNNSGNMSPVNSQIPYNRME